MKRAFYTPLLILCMCQLAFAEADFSGNWVYDASDSTQPDTGERIILHRGNVFRISRLWNSKIYSVEYIVDGLEHTYITPGNDRLKYTAVLTGNTLRITGTFDWRVATNDPYDHTYVLSRDGRTLTHTIMIMSRKGPVIEKAIYIKK